MTEKLPIWDDRQSNASPTLRPFRCSAVIGWKAKRLMGSLIESVDCKRSFAQFTYVFLCNCFLLMIWHPSSLESTTFHRRFKFCFGLSGSIVSLPNENLSSICFEDSCDESSDDAYAAAAGQRLLAWPSSCCPSTKPSWFINLSSSKSDLIWVCKAEFYKERW